MHVTVDDVNLCDSLECVYVKYKGGVSTARELLVVDSNLLSSCCVFMRF